MAAEKECAVWIFGFAHTSTRDISKLQFKILATPAVSRYTSSRCMATPSSSSLVSTIHRREVDKWDTCTDFIFGFGSIINDRSRRSSAPGCTHVVQARIHAQWEWTRCWNFRSPTGFTALGLVKRDAGACGASSVNGVVFPVTEEQLAAFDARETGYRRELVPPALWLAVTSPQLPHLARLERAVEMRRSSLSCWAYVPECDAAMAADAEHPLVQTYIDCVLEGCIALGGEAMAEEWITSTHGWSQFYLNDVPMSRRPWLHRGTRYREIDRLLAKHGAATLFEQRRHPEGFAARFLSESSGGLRGSWGVPARNPQFTGRTAELAALRSELHTATNEVHGGVAMLAVCGLGGVGKTQLAAEYCHTQYQLAYGVVVWLRAESADSIAADLCQFARDNGVDVDGLPTIDVVGKMKAKLFRTKWPWLIVFDNVNAPHEYVDAFIPRGNDGGLGHVLLTSRTPLARWKGRLVQLDCFARSESLRFLRAAATVERDAAVKEGGGTATTEEDGEEDESVANVLATQLGDFPLALAVAVAYMRRCDLSCAAYSRSFSRQNERLLEREQGRVAEHPQSIRSSLSLSLENIQRESPAARAVLSALCFLAPDQITKRLLRLLLGCSPSLIAAGGEGGEEEESSSTYFSSGGVISGSTAATALGERGATRTVNKSSSSARVGMDDALALVASRFNIDAHELAQFWASAKVQALLPPRSSSSAASSTLAPIDVAAARAVDESTWPGGFVPPRTPAHRHSSPSHAASGSTSTSGWRDWAWTTEEGEVAEGRASSDAIERRTEEEEVQADEVWALMKAYSLLVVKDGESQASLHRLLQLLLRSNQCPRSASVAIAACVWAVTRLWRFDVNDSATWTQASALLDHVKTLATHASSRGVCRLRVGELLTSAAHYLSVALSHFGEAQDALESALAMIRAELQESKSRATAAACGGGGDSCGAVPRNVTEVNEGEEEAFDHPAAAAAMRRMGQVLRYRGDLDGAASWLDRALAMERRMSAGSPGLAETLHELGVLRARRGAVESARTLLEESLRIKVVLKLREEECEESEDKRSRDLFNEAATLHQLAVVAALAKPPRFDEAEELLQRVLAMTELTSSAARASSMQQLARIAMRRGAVQTAHTWLTEALTLHETAYRSQFHVNIAAAHQKLGLAEMAMKPVPPLACAEEHLRQCLVIRQRLYAADHVEVATALHSLGRLERARGGREKEAGALFEQQRAMLERLFDAEERRLLEEERRSRNKGFGASTLSLLMKKLTMAIGWQQVLARDCGDRKALRQLGADMQRLEERLSVALSYEERAATKDDEDANPAVVLGTACRTRVREGLLKMKMAKTHPPPAVGAMGSMRTMLCREAAALRLALSEAEDGGAGGDVCARFCASIEAAAAEDSKRAAFEACDALRAELAATLGVRIEDNK